jgi:hypothetical protein
LRIIFMPGKRGIGLRIFPIGRIGQYSPQTPPLSVFAFLGGILFFLYTRVDTLPESTFLPGKGGQLVLEHF